MAPRIPNIKFNNGKECPIFGLGTWKSKPGEVCQAVKDAIDAGYRHIDCAHVYGNEKEVGEALTTKLAEGVVKREDLFITSKLWNTFHSPTAVLPALKVTLKNLRLDYLDLYLIHWPFSFKEVDEVIPIDKDGNVVFTYFDYVDTWTAMEKLVTEGLTRSIGVSNFNKHQLERVLEVATIVPVTNQIECHPYLTQRKLIEFCKSKGIVVTAYSPLGSPDRPWAKPGDPQLLDDAKLKKIAAKHGKTPAQVAIRFALDRGLITIPKSVTKSRIIQNIDIFDFKLTPEEVDYINTFDCNGRICPFLEAVNHEYYPFHDEY